ncbi:MAG TPA: FAD-binding oxidoreductase [Steroidobacteraceae bacterium]|nr:FAD-binding oxidoreductase [Steroidobacteraceae bacterium]
MLESGLLTDLRAIVGDAGLITGERVRERAIDINGHVAKATAMVRPRSTAEVSAVMRLCHARHQPVVPQGGRTGLVDGTLTSERDLILSTDLMNRIERVDVPGRTMRVESGVILQRAQEEAERHELMFPLDLGGRGSCTIGGNIATNAGGVRVVRFGMMRALVLGVEAVLADGTVLCSLNRMLKNNAGYDLKQLFIGSEGTLGIVTRADLRLVARPRSTSTAFVACRDFAALVKVLGLMDSRLSGQLSAFEAMWPEFYDTVTSPRAGHAAVLPRGYGIYGLIESLGSDPQADQARLEQALEAAFEQDLIVDGVIAKSESERQAIWAPRDDPWQVPQQHGLTFNFDVSLAIEDMEAYLAGLRREVARRFADSKLFAFGHIADGNLHVIVAPGSAGGASREAVEDTVYEPLRAIGGSIAAEHGIGLERLTHLGISRTREEIDTMRLLKRALDPRGILNPGKVVG